jgi:serine/threonine protein kinase
MEAMKFYGGGVGYPQKYGDWEVIEPLGEGGQSTVYLVRKPTRVEQRDVCIRKLMESSGQGFNAERAREFAEASFEYARKELPSERGALKVFKIPANGKGLPPPPESEEFEAIERLKNEITVLSEKRLGLPALLGSNQDERWIVTEYFPERTLEHHASKYQGKVLPALRAFRSLVETVALIHKEGYVHRDIKPANVFVRNDDQLILGDFGIVYIPRTDERLTLTDERVGPRDYMPQWGDLGDRLEKVNPNFDVYMLGKLLWCMIAGRLKLPREYHRRAAFDLSVRFANDRHMHLINSILDKCVVEEPDHCLASGSELLGIVESTLATIERGTPLSDQKGKLVMPCRVCGRGFYQDRRSALRIQQFDEKNMPTNFAHLWVFVCNVCTHHAFFSPGYPGEAATRNWTPWAQ